jgi:hypothetical protein
MIRTGIQNLKIHKIISIITLLLFTLILLDSYCIAEDLSIIAENMSNKHNKSSNVELLIFSSTKHSFERNLIKKYDNISAQDLKKGLIYIALKDLNDDGVKEIFSYIEIFNYCGQQTGCPFNIYKIENKKLKSLLPQYFAYGFPIFIDINDSGIQNIVGILSSKTLGWRDIVVDSKTIWQWNGKSY